MKIITSIFLTLLLLTITLNALSVEEETETNQSDQNITAGCRPQPLCNQNVSTLEQWIDQLQMQQLMELLKTQQDQPTEATETPNK